MPYIKFRSDRIPDLEGSKFNVGVTNGQREVEESLSHEEVESL